MSGMQQYEAGIWGAGVGGIWEYLLAPQEERLEKTRKLSGLQLSGVILNLSWTSGRRHICLATVAEAAEDCRIGGRTLKHWAEICNHEEKRMTVRIWVQIHGLAQKAGNGVPVREGSTSLPTARQSWG